MQRTEQEKKTNQLSLEEKLPLVIEIIPGQAKEGLVKIYDPGEYETVHPKDLVEDTFRSEWSIEEQDTLSDIKRQLEGGGLLLYKGEELKDDIMQMVEVRETREGEKYLYAGFKALKPQEGGFYGR